MRTEFPADAREWVKALFFPPKCLCCEERVPPDRLFCPACAADLPEKPYHRVIQLEDGRELPVFSPLAYEGGYRESLLLYKFEGYQILALRIGLLIADLVDGLPKQDWAVTYVPLSQERRRDRGFDQSELLAWQVARHHDLPVLDLLKKTRRTKIQHELSREERLVNLVGAYQASGEAAGKDILLVDDIVTSGATLKECASMLYQAGARSVCGLCAAENEGSDTGTDQQAAGELWHWL